MNFMFKISVYASLKIKLRKWVLKYFVMYLILVYYRDYVNFIVIFFYFCVM